MLEQLAANLLLYSSWLMVQSLRTTFIATTVYTTHTSLLSMGNKNVTLKFGSNFVIKFATNQSNNVTCGAGADCS